jgi:hypothetical protein
MFLRLLAIAAAFFVADARTCSSSSSAVNASPNNCVSFQVSAGTGCAWMCNYCASTLGTTNYYFTDSVCTYETGGCVGSPQVGVLYTCCAN